MSVGSETKPKKALRFRADPEGFLAVLGIRTVLRRSCTLFLVKNAENVAKRLDKRFGRLYIDFS
jgi:hypothetical protein